MILGCLEYPVRWVYYYVCIRPRTPLRASLLSIGCCWPILVKNTWSTWTKITLHYHTLTQRNWIQGWICLAKLLSLDTYLHSPLAWPNFDFFDGVMKLWTGVAISILTLLSGGFTSVRISQCPAGGTGAFCGLFPVLIFISDPFCPCPS